MKKLLGLTTAVALCAGAANADVTVLGWGGAYGRAQTEAHVKPFQAETGIKATMTDTDNPAAPIKAMVEANNVTVNIVSLEYADVVRLCDEGLLEEIDPAELAPAPDGTPAEEDFLPGALSDCGVSTDVWATVFAYDDTRFPNAKPTTISDFFDLEKFPGKRGIRKGAKTTLEMALMADGVAADDVYDMLETPEGLERAFAKLDTIKNQVVWWEAGAQPPQLLADGEVVMSTVYNGRIFAAAMTENKPFVTVWDGMQYEFEVYAIPVNAPDMEDAKKFLSYATDTQHLADMTKYISYGPTRKSTAAMPMLWEDGITDMKPHLPTSEENMTNSLETSFEFWVDYDSELNERFNAWLAQ
ncbi:ABC transporter substrate-binding protein [Falsirhodobacter sp. alg1]|uniref:ABC transporter substrate-binding protein n=1 Tax=Falsirhodobacter sp. alg1 TaxID=1472418 RepID=UPI0005ED62A8|nr:ABC transporter substrate-binding protein [Falsirhodobacter sp. alg1]